MNTEIALALSKALAYAAVGNEDKARKWTRRLVRCVILCFPGGFHPNPPGVGISRPRHRADSR